MALRKLFMVTFLVQVCFCEILPEPEFSGPIVNITTPVGRESVLACTVHDISIYKVAWLRVDTQTILTIHNHVLTKNKRITVTQSDQHTWHLHVRDVRESDKGWYMCQINTDPMKSQVGYMDVVVPPDILDNGTSTDMMVREGSPVTLKCSAAGSPPPQVVWRRENGELIRLREGLEALMVSSSTLGIAKVTRKDMGAYLCIASNGVPPSVSKRIVLHVHFPPTIWIRNQLVGAIEKQTLALDCHSEAYPKSINYWTREKGEVIPDGGDYKAQLTDDLYRVHARLIIKSVSPGDFGTFKCVSKNALGDTDGNIKVVRVGAPPMNLTKMEMTKKNEGVNINDDSYYNEEDTSNSCSKKHLKKFINLTVLFLYVLL